MISRRRKRRHGTTLIELVVVISISAVIGTAAAMLLATLLSADRGARRHLHQTGSLSRLAQQFRADAAAAEQANLEPAAAPGEASPPAAARLLFALPGDVSVAYAPEAGRVIRRESGGPGASRQESYALPEGSELKFSVASQPPHAFAGMALSHGAADRRTRPGWRVEAEIGRDRRRAAALQKIAAGAQAAPENQP